MFKRRKPDEPITGEPAVLSVDPPPFKPGSEAVAARTEATFSNGPDDFGLGVPPFRPAPTQIKLEARNGKSKIKAISFSIKKLESLPFLWKPHQVKLTGLNSPRLQGFIQPML